MNTSPRAALVYARLSCELLTLRKDLRMNNPSGVNSRRAQTLVTVREMVLRGELTSGRAIEEVELSRALGASRPIVRATLERLYEEGLLEELSAGEYVPRVLSSQDIADAIEARGALESL